MKYFALETFSQANISPSVRLSAYVCLLVLLIAVCVYTALSVMLIAVCLLMVLCLYAYGCLSVYMALSVLLMAVFSGWGSLFKILLPRCVGVCVCITIWWAKVAILDYLSDYSPITQSEIILSRPNSIRLIESALWSCHKVHFMRSTNHKPQHLSGPGPLKLEESSNLTIVDLTVVHGVQRVCCVEPWLLHVPLSAPWAPLQ